MHDVVLFRNHATATEDGKGGDPFGALDGVRYLLAFCWMWMFWSLVRDEHPSDLESGMLWGN